MGKVPVARQMRRHLWAPHLILLSVSEAVARYEREGHYGALRSLAAAVLAASFATTAAAVFATAFAAALTAVFTAAFAAAFAGADLGMGRPAVEGLR